MHSFLRHLTLGAILGFAAMIGMTGQAQALLIGNPIETTLLYPTTSTVVLGPDVKTVVDPGIEYTNFLSGQTNVQIDFKDTMIKLTALDNITFATGGFNGLRFKDSTNSIPDWAVSVNGPNTTVSGFGLSYNANEIFLNVSGLSVNNGDMIALDVRPVPEPSTMLLLGTGLAGVVAWRMRKVQETSLA
ncbi:MAG: PEP-CTERM sorting domain-containing protein [Nitrospirae bacterium]|nr:MAG: PEP-CTERM sorting domain-containing protein [Nitrospirota bacterium]